MNAGTFMGFHRPNGAVGIRNHVLVLSITGLTGPSASRIGASVSGTHTISVPYSTGLIGRDRDIHLRTLEGLACNPNVGAVLIVSDHVPKAKIMANRIAALGQSVDVITMDDAGQDAISLVAEGTRKAARLVNQVSALSRAPAKLSDLRIGLKCGRSDPSSGLAANPATGNFVDRLVDAGGTAVFGEVVEWLGAEHILKKRAATAEIGDKLVALAKGREADATKAQLDLMGNNPSPTNIERGISSIEEKSLGGISKTGSRPILGVLDYGQEPAGPGLFAMDTANYAPEHLTGLAASGCQLHLFTTGAGNSFVSGLCPTVKICANSDTAARLAEQIDVNLSCVMSDRDCFNQVAIQIEDVVLAICGGQLSFGEILKEGGDTISRFGAAL